MSAVEKPRRVGLGWRQSVLILLLAFVIPGCRFIPVNFSTVDYTPIDGKDWLISSPEDQGLDPDLLTRLYKNAAELDTLYGVLIVKNDQLIAEKYFNGGQVDKRVDLASVTKSYVSTLRSLTEELMIKLFLLSGLPHMGVV
jgi:hypothetical protein